ncbi:hypothetical protein SAMN05518672_11225 [Chitinophaga sp. CF118]|uniref:hypothetical protein n=1 Tax=Chitinophaga sp. CF118 TaxID=1884367 RepID=UPI0008F44A76|nr:hypothetical protein [Chitinophaga sp. CF118]SFE91271.1 hypothetical protein SAMN05518672_11225 [Chitinophaga sp. CF118]
MGKRSIYSLFITVAICFCSGCSIQQKKKASVEIDSLNTEGEFTKENVIAADSLRDEQLENTNNPQGGTSDSAYHERTIKPAIYSLNDQLKVVYFEDSIQEITCALYLKSELGVIDSTRRPINYASLLNNLESSKVMLIINNTSIKLNAKIRDSEIMMPTYLGYFSLFNKNYLLIKMNLVSSMSGDYWYNLLLEIDSEGEIINQQGIETTGEITFIDLKNHIS